MENKQNKIMRSCKTMTSIVNSTVARCRRCTTMRPPGTWLQIRQSVTKETGADSGTTVFGGQASPWPDK